jgi:hypothetical protein
MRIILLLFFAFFLWVDDVYSQNTSKNFTISGYIKEASSGELLIGVAVYSPKYERGNITNTYGFFSLTLPAVDSLEIIISSFGYVTQKRIVALTKDVELNASLTPDITTFEEVIIELDEYKKESEHAKISSIEIPIQQIKDVPAILGEKDVFKVLQLMPGVKKGSEGNSGLYVRGGGPEQNLIILDDAVVYNAYHLFGFFSLFNGDAIKSVELIKGGFPARYGGRLSSVVEMNMKEGNKEEFHGEAGIGLLSSRLTLEGPIKKGKSSFLVSGRRTYIDLLIYPLLPAETKGGYNFHDFNAKINYDFGAKNKVYVSSYFGRDKFFLRSKNDQNKFTAGIGWSNATATARWNHLFSNKIFGNTSVVFSNYRFKIFEESYFNNEVYKLKYYSGIRDIAVKFDLDYLPNTTHSLRVGVLSTYHTFTPGAMVLKDSYTNESENIIKKINALESGIYIEDIYKQLDRLTINAGFRLTNFITEGKTYLNPEPRLSAGYKLNNNIAIKAGYSVMNQYIHLLSNTGIGLPTDLWVPATKNVKPQQSHQLAGGITKDFTAQKTALTIEGYYKKTERIIGYKEGSSFLVIDDPSSSETSSWEQTVTSGQSWSYGAEILLHKKTGKFSGWIGYTLSWTQLQFDSLNQGEKYYAKYDRRHDVSLVGIYQLNKKVSLSATWVYGTSNAINLPFSEYTAPNHQVGFPSYYSYNDRVSEYGKRNSSRMPAYHRLDVGVQFHKPLKRGSRTWEISVYNLYNRKNPFYYFIGSEGGSGGTGYKNVLKEVTLFPFIPSISYQRKF